MNLHEFQAKEYLEKQGIPVSKGVVVRSVGEATAALDQYGMQRGVVKAQVHAGGRGKAGGVRLGQSREELKGHVKEMLGMRLITKQTGEEGVLVDKLLLCELTEIVKEYYIAATIDRKRAKAVLIASPEGGVEIEEVAERNPEAILTLPMRFDGHLRSYQLAELCKHMGWQGEVARQGGAIALALAKAFIRADASLLEINPLVLTPDGDLVAIDAKMSIDDNALFRHPDLSSLFDPTQLPEREVQAMHHDLSYVALKGNIGCMVNGAGLAMATMDVIQHFGGKPANFLDVGGGATHERVAEGLKIILSDPDVQSVLVNIFGGITSCVAIAEGILGATKETPLDRPLIVRLEGTHVDQGRKILEESGLNIITAGDLAEAAKKAVEAAK